VVAANPDKIFTRSAHSQGRGPTPTQITLTITKTTPGSFIGLFDFPSHIYAAASLSNRHLAASGRNQRGCQPFGQQPQYNEQPTNRFLLL